MDIVLATLFHQEDFMKIIQQSLDHICKLTSFNER
jgi:hypothetical protein